jgi:hypothetical protein
MEQIKEQEEKAAENAVEAEEEDDQSVRCVPFAYSTFSFKESAQQFSSREPLV